MEFHAVQDMYTFSGGRKRTGSSAFDFYRACLKRHAQELANGIRNKDVAGATDASDFCTDLLVEFAWWQAGRPYYNVWPAMIEILQGFDCSKVPFRSFVEVPDPAIALRFPIGLEYDNAMCLSVLAGKDVNGCAHVAFCAQFNEIGCVKSGVPEYLTQSSIMTVRENCLDTAAADHGDTFSYSSLQKFGLAVLLMERDSQVFEPDILAKDSVKYASADDEGKKRLEEKAFRRRGQRGYHIGRKLESIPHFRRPHPALFWTGKGRSTARVVMRRGCVVNRQQMTKAPTGFMGAFGEAETDKEV